MRSTKFRFHLGHGLLENGVTLVGCNLPQGLQYKVPQVHPGVRDHQVIRFQNQVIIQQDIQVQRPGAPTNDPLPVGRLLDLMQPLQQLLRGKKGLQRQAGIQKIKNKIDYWKNLLTSDPMKEAMGFLWKKTKGLLHHILPRRMTGRIHFGFEDPSKTGKTLAYFSMLYPFTKENLVIEPEFETEELILEGDIAFRGRIRLGYLVYVVLSVVLNNNIRRQYKRLRQGGNKDGEGRN